MISGKLVLNKKSLEQFNWEHLKFFVLSKLESL